MDKKLKKRITLFYIGGVINGLLGLYVLIDGPSFLPPDTTRTLVIIFLLSRWPIFISRMRSRKNGGSENAGKQAQDNEPIQR